VSWLDVKLGLRMLIRYPGLTVIGGLALAIAIGIGGGVLHFFQIYLRPVVPLDAGDRIVSIVNWDATTNRRESQSLHDFVAWREQLTALEDVAAFRTIERKLIADERAGAGAVVVIGHDVWRSRFGFDRNAVGSRPRLSHSFHVFASSLPTWIPPYAFTDSSRDRGRQPGTKRHAPARAGARAHDA
jgi:putative ABC transport system permease protein